MDPTAAEDTYDSELLSKVWEDEAKATLARRGAEAAARFAKVTHPPWLCHRAAPQVTNQRYPERDGRSGPIRSGRRWTAPSSAGRGYAVPS